MTVYNSRSPANKTPYGAVTSGTVVRFCIAPEAHRFPLRGSLIYEREGETGVVYNELTLDKSSDNTFTAELDTSGFTGLIHYAFRFENDGGCFFYGAHRGKTGGEAAFYGGDKPTAYQLTVYHPHPPDAAWFGNGITYQIFPDRFAASGEIDQANQPPYRWFHADKSDTPHAEPEHFEGRLQVANRDFYGGNFRGIIEKLGYLQSLHVTTIYLNPIFAAFSNHRYDTGDYHKIDSLLGTEQDFKDLCNEAKARGMRIILDGVFSHTGSDSAYFNKRGTYDSVGAYQSQSSPYYSWYSFNHWPDAYVGWWGEKTLPETVEDDPSFAAFIADEHDENCVIRRWLRLGASGWRLDVADELPDSFIARIKRAALAERPDALVIGEVWEDATNKISYGSRRRYLLGGSLDGVMGYTFRAAVLEYLRGGGSAAFRESIETTRENYPPFAFNNMMNLLGTHDTPRILTLLGTQPHDWHGSKESRSALYLDKVSRETAQKLQKLGVLLQYTLPGTPSVYYGDEAGMEGADDPFCRRFYPWGAEDEEMIEWYRKLGNIRAMYMTPDSVEQPDRTAPPDQSADLQFLTAPEPVVAFRRILSRSNANHAAADNAAAAPFNNVDACVTVIVNRSTDTQPVILPPSRYKDLITGKTIDCMGVFFAEPYGAYVLTANNA